MRCLLLVAIRCSLLVAACCSCARISVCECQWLAPKLCAWNIANCSTFWATTSGPEGVQLQWRARRLAQAHHKHEKHHEHEKHEKHKRRTRRTRGEEATGAARVQLKQQQQAATCRPCFSGLLVRPTGCNWCPSNCAPLWPAHLGPSGGEKGGKIMKINDDTKRSDCFSSPSLAPEFAFRQIVGSPSERHFWLSLSVLWLSNC